MRDPGSPDRLAAEPGILYFLRLAFRRILFLAAVSLLAGVLALGIGFLLPRWYQARAAILPPHESQPALAIRQSLVSALQLQSVLPYTAGVTLLDVYLAILNSDTLARSLVDRYGLREHYHQPLRVRAVAALRSHTTIMPREGLIEVTVEDKDPGMAADLANGYVAGLDSLFRSTRSGAGRREREFLTDRVGRTEAALDSSEAALAAAQESTGVTALSQDLTEAAAAAGELLGRRLALSVRLEMLDVMGVGDSPVRRELQTELDAVDSQASRLPLLGQDVARRLRDVRIQDTLFRALSQELEAARIEEVRNTPTVEVLDRAVPPDHHSRPRKGMMALAGAFAGLFLGMVWAVYWDPRN